MDNLAASKWNGYLPSGIGRAHKRSQKRKNITNDLQGAKHINL